MDDCRMDLRLLVDFQEGRLDPTAAEQLRTHLDAGCVACRDNLAWLERTFASLRATDLLPVPEAALKRARAIFRKRRRAPLLPTLIARLIADSRRAQPALAGARGAARGVHQQLYSAGDYEIHLWQERTGDDAWYVIGQALLQEGEVVRPSVAVLVQADGSLIASTWEDLEFHFSHVPAGTHQLHLLIDGLDIAIPDVEVGEQRPTE